MKGGYQILDLTGATAGSPVEVKGIYKAAASNNGKPVLILTNDGQRVYAEIAEDDGDYITCYISAEGKTVNITIEPDDSVTTVVSDPGASITGLEQAVNELSDNKAAKSDITDLVCTGIKNTTGNTILADKYFYLNGALCKAKVDIANNATFTLNTNFTVVTIDEELSALNSNLSNLYKKVWSGSPSTFPATTTNFTNGNLTGYTYAGVLVDNVLYTIKMGVRTRITLSFYYDSDVKVISRVFTVNATNFVTEDAYQNDVISNNRIIPNLIVGIH